MCNLWAVVDALGLGVARLWSQGENTQTWRAPSGWGILPLGAWGSPGPSEGAQKWVAAAVKVIRFPVR